MKHLFLVQMLLVLVNLGAAQTISELESHMMTHYESGNYFKALDYANKLKIGCIAEFGEGDECAIITSTYVAIMTAAAGQFEKAEKQFLQTLNRAEKQFGIEHENYKNVMEYFIESILSSGRNDKVVEYSKEIDFYIKSNYSDTSTEYLEWLLESAKAHFIQEDSKTVGKICLDGLKIIEHVPTKKSIYFDDFMVSAIQTFAGEDSAKFVFDLIDEALEYTKKTRSDTSYVYGYYLTLLSQNLSEKSWEELTEDFTNYYRDGRYELAEATGQQARILAKYQFGVENYNYGVSLNNLALVYGVMGQYEQALPICIESLSNALSNLGEKHWEYGNRLNNLAGLYCEMGEYDKAIPLYNEALINIANSLGVEHPNYGNVLNNLAGVYVEMELFEKALPLYEESIENASATVGKSHIEYGTRLNNLASLYENTGEYDKAIPLLTEALENTEINFGSIHPVHDDRLNRLANNHMKVGDYSMAISLFHEAIKYAEIYIGKLDVEYGNRVRNLADSYYAIGDYNKALPYYLEAMENTLERLGKNHLEYGNRLNSVALVYRDMGEYQKAMSFSNSFLEFAEKNVEKEPTIYGTALHNHAVLFRSIGKYDEAISLFLKAIEYVSSYRGKSNVSYATSLIMLSEVFDIVGDYEKAIPLIHEAWEIIEDSVQIGSTAYTVCLHNMAMLYKSLEKYEQALAFYKKALESSSFQGKTHPLHAVCLSGLAGLHEALGEYEEALPLYSEALHIIVRTLGKEHQEYSTVLVNLAILNIHLGDYEQVFSLSTEALDIIADTFGKDHPKYGVCLGIIGLYYTYMGQYDRAIPIYSESLDNVETNFGNEHPRYGVLLSNLSAVYEEIGDYASALSLNLDALEKMTIIHDEMHSKYGMVNSNLALLYFRMGQFEMGLPYLLESNKVIMAQLDKVFRFRSEREKRSFMSTINYRFDISESVGWRTKNEFEVVTGMNLINQLIRKGLLLNSYTNVLGELIMLNDSIVNLKIYNLQTAKRELERQNSLGISEKSLSIDSLTKVVNNIESELVVAYHTRFDSTRSLIYDWREVKEKLQPSELSIEFSHFGYRGQNGWTDSTLYVAYVFGRDWEHPKAVYLFEEKELETVLHRDPDSMESYEDHVNRVYKEELYDLVWEPLDSLLDGVTSVHYSPSGLLNEVSFSAMRSDDGTYLGDRYEMNHLSSTSQLLEQEEEPKATDLMPVVYGGMYYDLDTTALRAEALAYEGRGSEGYELVSDSTRGATWKYLEGTKKEAELISGLFAKNAVSTRNYTGSKATEESFKYGIPRDTANFLHIGTHGFFYPNVKRERKEFQVGSDVFRYAEDPMFRSGLIMAGGNRVWRGGERLDGIDDGVLTSYEVSNTDLRNTELVVLSACETGRGDINGSEGVYGLQRAFKMAGVDKLIMSLWKVPDAQTAELMGKFYERWLSGRTVSESFREAQKEMSKKYEPYYWGAFTLFE